MRICITGHKGNIGSCMLSIGYDFLDCDVTKPKEIDSEIERLSPDVIVHLAGKSGVNWCEKKENQEEAIQINFRGASNLFASALAHNAKVVYISSDHIFGGMGFGNYSETDKPNPKNYYGTLKLAAEALTKIYPNVNVVRTSTLFWKNRPLISDYLNDVREGKDVYPPQFIWRSFMHVDHFVSQLTAYCQTIEYMPRVLNLSGSKVVSWYRFVEDYVKMSNLDVSKVHPRYMEDRYTGCAPRPSRSGVDTRLSKSLGFAQYSYLDGIQIGL